MKKKAKLHEILAAEPGVKGQSSKIFQETITTFNKKESHFTGMSKTFKLAIEGGEQLPDERKELVATVGGKLDHTFKYGIESLLLTMQKEETNSSGTAKAVLVVDGKEFGEYSATTFLAMENAFVEIRKVLADIPTLDMTVLWEENENGHYQTKPEIRAQLASRDKFESIAKATEHHPEQVVKVKEQYKLGDWTTLTWSGKIKPREKADMIERVDKIIKAVKLARCQANNVDVVDVTSPKSLFEFILGK